MKCIQLYNMGRENKWLTLMTLHIQRIQQTSNKRNVVLKGKLSQTKFQLAIL